ncbi:MAG: hypothetical protein A2499_09365 [Stygiobacter sp. RIFOXYC12_FULL_38_8]|nr:MAG: hypothetical protein A2279_04255 [Stygiobacter sp. RIFOXYA12_FULL_38_9]OGV06390.1 MAG: hypothetical protein A2299_14960 [Stygiobacter sp. RIFOXYB2_FULL_37_11]OGV13984.1 MAG: hypothetical protein A2440_18650 [Stygiobacter sp. RIFOXYC2_FULL_38_25]OGV14371.1 MAG: hypothetical protein A2237_00115 [Stygiobacter sp. RIFOXYA2_FULL_38_8]OGV26084.1 MAG: hypothetical protein A2499_09365 [Stygiobacter sp. RIFOXYC12_FULL_38_8]OGV82315.1 MAG: hypothetical protein A2X65_18135 [Stygiobacter sp. GWF2_
MIIDRNSVWGQIVRGFGYASISILTLFSGYMMQNGISTGFNISVLAMLILLSIPFFIVYGFTYTYSTEEKHFSVYEPFGIGFVISLLGAIIVYQNVKNNYSSDDVLLTPILVYGILFNGLTLFYLVNTNKSKLNHIRYQLIWPVVLSIAISLYFGMNYSFLSEDYRAYIPTALIVISFFISEFFAMTKRTFLVFQLCSLLVVVILISILNYSKITPHNQYFTSLIFCIILSAYLSAFEAWRIISYVIKNDTSEVGDNSKGANYYYASLLGLTLSLLFIPLGFIFTRVGVIFLFGFTIHASASLIYWLKQGRDYKKIGNSEWNVQKLIFGFMFVIILVFDSLMPIYPEKDVLPSLIAKG